MVKPPAPLLLSLDNETAGFVILERRKSDRPRAEQRRSFLPFICLLAKRKAKGKATSRTAEEGSGNAGTKGRAVSASRAADTNAPGGEQPQLRAGREPSALPEGNVARRRVGFSCFILDLH